jgi:xanthine dehydrogenase small subunit
MTSLAAPARIGLTAVNLTVNGREVELAVPGGRRLLDILRLDLGLTGSKEGCGEGECGACSVLLDGRVVDACLVPACQVDGRDVRTVEGLAGDGRLDPLQDALVEVGGIQCGFCTPGMLISGRAFLDSGAPRTDSAIRTAIAGNLCRCTGYTRIVEAIRKAPSNPGGVAGATAAAGSTAVAGSKAVAGATAELEPDRAGIDLGDPAAVTPRTVREAYALVADGGFRPIAGCTDVLVEHAAGVADGRTWLDLSGLGELRAIGMDRAAIDIGACATFADIRENPLVGALAPALAVAAAQIGAAQVQNRATIGGNIAGASPAADSLPVLLALDADIVVGGTRGERTIPARDFFRAYRRTALASDELIGRVRIPSADGRTCVFRKIAPRAAQAIGVVSIALSWRRHPDGSWLDVRVALGSVAPTPVRARAAEAALEGHMPAPETAAAAVAALDSDINPIDDVRATAGYRRAVAGRVLLRLLRDAGGW